MVDKVRNEMVNDMRLEFLAIMIKIKKVSLLSDTGVVLSVTDPSYV